VSMFGGALLLAHCGANWKYCDGGTAGSFVLMLFGIRWAAKRADAKAKRRRAAERDTDRA
jgi:hypothetical protein